MTAPANQPLEITHYLTSGGAIMASATDVIEVGEADQLDEYIGDAVNINFQEDASSRQDSAPKVVMIKHTVEFQRPFAKEGRVSGKFKLLAYVQDDATGETLAATQEFDAKACGPKPKLTWSLESAKPGDRVDLDLESFPEAVCGLSIVDKSVDLVPNANKVNADKLQKLKEKVLKARIVNDKVPGEKCQDARLLFKAFEKLGLYVLSDQLQENTKCDSLIDVTNLKDRDDDPPQYFDGPVALAEAAPVGFGGGADYADEGVREDDSVAFSAASPVVRFKGGPPPPPTAGNAIEDEEQEEVEAPTLDIRNYFPETWLFELVDADADGKYKMEANAPHTITTWLAEAVCSHEDAGLTVVDMPSKLLVAQDFFVDLKVPFSTKRGEILQLNVTAFNRKSTRSLPLRLTVHESDEYKSGESNYDVCLEASGNAGKTFMVKMKELNEVNITVEAAIVDDIPNCDPAGEAVGFADTLQKPVQVRPEGYPVEKVESEFACRKDNDTEAVIKLPNLDLPSDDELVQGSARAWLMVTGDIMAPAMANLDKLVKMPYGCGEQNMISMVPNIYVVDYLEGTGADKAKAKLIEKAKKYMKKGYDRQNNNYRHADGSYSVWGPRDENAEGSMWLTAFVIKAFNQASSHIDIDAGLMAKSMAWVKERQDSSTGCFKPEGYNIHSEFKGSEVTLTASILISMLENINKEDAVENKQAIEAAMRCLKSNINDKDLYTKSLVTYALTLRGGDSATEAVEKLNELLEVANTNTSGKLYWKTPSVTSYIVSKDVEMTSYNVLSLVKQNKLPEALKAIKWLATQRNSRGGFKSTQDTMIALQAITEYSLRVSKQPNDISMTADIAGTNVEFQITEENELLLQRQKIDMGDSGDDVKVEANVNGGGCYMIQTVLRYNLQRSPDQEAFNLTVTQDAEGKINFCAQYTGAKAETNMVVLELELLSGYAPKMFTLDALKDSVADMPVKKFEYDEKKNSVALYFNSVPKDKLGCGEFMVTMESVVEELKPAIAKIYDYYDQKDVVSTEYFVEAPEVIEE